MIQDLTVMLYPLKGTLNLAAPWVNTSLQAFENAGWTQKFMGTFFTGPTSQMVYCIHVQYGTQL